MKQILGASKVFCCNETFEILDNAGVLIECDPHSAYNHICQIQDFQTLTKEYPEIPSTFYADSILMPSLTNAHIHFEFSANKTQLLYGKFGTWLESVITHRDSLFEHLQENIQEAITSQLHCGVGSVGAISSYGYDITALAQSPLRVTLFNEAIGSNPAMLDVLYQNLQARFEECQNLKNPRFTPALAIHSPYSTHKVLIQKVIQLCKAHQAPLSCHFLESIEELEWLTQQKGWFVGFFQKYFNVASPKPSIHITEFLELMRDLNPLFVHCLYADLAILQQIRDLGGSIITCPRSNRLLNQRYFNTPDSVIFATDGLSSNYSLSLLDELRVALFAYENYEIEELAKHLILGSTLYPAKALQNNNGILKKGKLADIAIFECKGISQSSQEALQFILHCKEVTQLYLNGIGVLNGTNA